MKLPRILITILFALAGAISAHAQPPSADGTLTGSVRDTLNDQPVAYADIVVKGTGKGGISQSDGVFRVPGIAPGVYDIIVSSVGYGSIRLEGVRIGPDSTTNLPISMNLQGAMGLLLRKQRSEARAIPEELLAAVRAIADSTNAFAWDLYQSISKGDGDLFLSPFSVATTLGVLGAGAREETRREIREILRQPARGPDLPAQQAVLRSLRGGSDAGAYALSQATQLWCDSNDVVRDSYTTLIDTVFGAGLQAVPFSRSPEKSRAAINQWVSEETNGLITAMLPPGFIDSETRLIVTDAIHFSGFWDYPFGKNGTRPAPFYRSTTDSIVVPMMKVHGKFDFYYDREARLKAIDLPYEADQIVLTVLLPDKPGDLDEIEERLNADFFNGCISRLHETSLDVFLPKFSIRDQCDLPEPLKQLGIQRAFQMGIANFSEISESNSIFLSRFIHEAYVDVNEEGTEASAASVAGFTTGRIVIPPAPPVFRADHPFFFVIRDRVTGLILFMGRLIDPNGD